MISSVIRSSKLAFGSLVSRKRFTGVDEIWGKVSPGKNTMVRNVCTMLKFNLFNSLVVGVENDP